MLISDADVVETSGDPERFLEFWSQLCSDRTRNFASLGRVTIGSYKEAVQFLLLENQVCGPYLGRAKLNEEQMNPYFPLAMSDSTDRDKLRMLIIDFTTIQA